MKRIILPLAAALLLSSCGGDAMEKGGIKLPILEEEEAPKYSTATVALSDVEQSASVSGGIGYIYADTLYTDFESNFVEFTAQRGEHLSEGDPIAVFDSSKLDYDYNNQKILTDDAYKTYLAVGSEAARLEYEIQQKQLEYIEYKKDQFTIRAPYDCVVTGIQRIEAGALAPEGTQVCTVAKEDGIYVYATDHKELFHLGMSVKVKFGGSDGYDFYVAMLPEEGAVTSKKEVNPNACVVLKARKGEMERVIADVDNVISAGWATIIVPAVSEHGVMTVPAAALKTFGGDDVCLLMQDGKTVRVPVEVGGVYGSTAVIRSGLCVGDVVAY